MHEIRALIFLVLTVLFPLDILFSQNCPTDEFGRKSGECSYFDSNKNRWITANFQDGNLHGPYVEYGMWKS
ncbi:MAG: hypothetical protein AAF544_08480, partial [Bacteroidota bacterium]